MGPSSAATPLGTLLRGWRDRRGLSQLALALAADVSSRHLSFLETGRSRPSRTMVLRLAEALELPLRERNALLEAAGFAAVYSERPLDDRDLAPVRRALERWLAAHEPYPAFVLDRAWNVLLANRAHERLLEILLPEAAGDARAANMMALVLDPTLLRPRIRNWELVAHVLGQRVRRRRLQETDPATRARLGDLLRQPGVAAAIASVEPPPGAEAVLPLEIEHEGVSLRLFSAIAALGTPRDVTLDEIAIETLFPADDATDAAVRALEERDATSGSG